MHDRILLTFALSLVVGCSSGDSGSSVAKVDGFCAEWAVRACNAQVIDRCAAPDADTCRATQATFCESIVPAGKYSPDAAKGCLDAVEKAYADAELDPTERLTVRELGAPCDLILSGDAGPGDACTADSDCSREAGLTCVLKNGTEGTCQVAEEVTGGQDCSAAAAECTEGFYCDGSNCLALKGEGKTCSEAVPCAPEYNCEMPDGTAAAADAGVAACVARAETGQDCEKSTDCVSGICSVGATGAGVCAGKVILAPTEPICDDLR